MNRNPEPYEDYVNSKSHPLYSDLVERKIILDANLNLLQVDTLPEQFGYQLSQNKQIKVETRLLEKSKEIDAPSYELTFKENNKVVLKDTLEFGFPPDVTFFTTDLNNDGKQELLTIYRWYIVNGDNFDLTIYELKKETE